MMHCLILRNQVYPSLHKALQKYSRRRYSSSQAGRFREAGFGKFLVVITPVLGVGGVITYAKYDEKFRQTVEENIPGSATILKYALQEEHPFEELSRKIEIVSKQFSDITKSIEETTSTVTKFFNFSGFKETVDETPQESFSKPEIAKSPAVKTPIPSEADEKTKTKPMSSEPVKQTKSPEVLPSTIVELEKDIEISASLALQEYKKAISMLKKYNDDVIKVVDQAVENFDLTAWNKLRNKTSARDTSVASAEKSANQALSKIEKCEIALGQIVDGVNSERVLEVRKKIKTITDHISSVKDELYNAKNLALASEKYWKKVESARNYFIDEMESIFPGINLAEKKLNLSKEDFDLFIMHAYSHVLTYQKELQRLQANADLQIKRAVAALRGDNQTEAVQAQIEYHLETEKRKLAIENQKRILQIRSESERDMRQQLKLQAQAHIDHLNDAIIVKEAELKRKFNRELDEKLSTEKAAYKLQLASMLGKLRGMDAALKARAETEKSAQQAQSLWAACQALWATVRTGEPGVHWTEKLRPLKSEIKAVAKVSEGDELVTVVLGNLPKEAENRGVFPEDALRERFLKVEKLARRVALVPETGGSLPIYFLSYLQSIFLLPSFEKISQDELHNRPYDFSKLDTHDILNRARYFVDRGDLMQAVKYMNLLKGAPRKVASDWIKEARLLLETQQAANTLMAHAAASGLLYL